jgi:hypothetical protein
MVTTAASPVEYALPIGDQLLPLNAQVGRRLQRDYLGTISCIHCGRKTSKRFSQGYCFPCFRSLAQCDSCIVKPETCHFDAGTCREPDWAMQFCMQDHFVYLANSSGLKVGITRGNQVPTRWMDQGAAQALPIVRVRTRQQSGFVEVELGNSVTDRTNWRAMLRQAPPEIDLAGEARRLLELHDAGLDRLRERFGIDAITVLDDAEPWSFDYPVIEYPTKVTSMNLDKQPQIAGRLMGIKGQYLIFDCGVINMRNFAGYHCSLLWEE